MDNKTRIACSRIRYQWNLSSKIVDEKGQYRQEWVEDMATIVDAYLSEHQADDNLPITEERLRAKGFMSEHSPGWLKWGHVQIIADSGQFETAWVSPCAVYDLKTMGDVYRLCSATGTPCQAVENCR